MQDLKLYSVHISAHNEAGDSHTGTKKVYSTSALEAGKKAISELVEKGFTYFSTRIEQRVR